MATLRVGANVETFGLEEKLRLFTATGAKSAIRSGTSRAGQRGKTLVRRLAPVNSGADGHPGRGRDTIRSKTISLGSDAEARVFIAGGRKGPGFYMYFQDQGTGERHNRRGAARGFVEPQYFFERGAVTLEGELPVIYDVAIEKALIRAGLR